MAARRMSNTLLALMLALAVPLGAAGAWFVWSTFNLWEHGGASAARLGMAAVAAGLLVALVWGVWRLLDRQLPG